MRHRCALGLLALLLICTSGAEQNSREKTPVEVSGSVQSAFSSGRKGGRRETGERFNRSEITLTYGHWTAKASTWNYVFCDWHDLDETYLQYSKGNTTAKLGRLRLPVGQSTWDDQWYSIFVFLPSIEASTYRNQKLLERTSVGVQADQSYGNSKLQIALTSDENEQNRVLASNLKRLSARYSIYSNGRVYGISGFTSLDSGFPEHLVVADIRATLPHFILRASALQHKFTGGETTGWFVEGSHRPKNWQDVTLAVRWDVLKQKSGRSELFTLGSKIRLPLDTDLMINYSAGPSINTAMLGGGWAFGLSKTIRF